MSDEEKEWGYWNTIDAYRLYEGVFLQHGCLPPRDIHFLSHEEKHDWYHSVLTMADCDADFKRVLASLRADKNVGKEFRDKEAKDAAYHHVARDTFLYHWKKCGLPIHDSAYIEKRGRPPNTKYNTVLSLAQNYKKSAKSYEDFLAVAQKDFGYDIKTVRNKMPKKKYQQL